VKHTLIFSLSFLVACSDSVTNPPQQDASPDVSPDVSADIALDQSNPVDVPVALDVRTDVSIGSDGLVLIDARTDVADASVCATATEGGACTTEGSFCGGPCTNPCQFCNILRCMSSRWSRIEVPPLPPSMCRDAGTDVVDVTMGINCDPRTVSCDALPPPCPGGGEVRQASACWGACVLFDRCNPITCDPDATTLQCPNNTVCFRTTRRCGLPVM
jgi:hypothetical protein